LAFGNEYVPTNSSNNYIAKKSKNVQISKLGESEEEMKIDIRDGIIVINDSIVTDFEVYKQLYNLEI